MIPSPDASAVNIPSHSGENAVVHHCGVHRGDAAHHRIVTITPIITEISHFLKFFMPSTILYRGQDAKKPSIPSVALSMDGFSFV